MMETFICKLYSEDGYSVENATDVFLNDPAVNRYTFWKRNKKQLYATPRCFMKEAMDLFYLSLMVFYVDRKVERSKSGDAWTRDLEVYMPVFQLDKWNRFCHDVEATLCFLTGDNWTFHFRERTALTQDEMNYKKSRHLFRRTRSIIDTDVFCMLSGGLDSFIGAIDLLSEGKMPIFVGNYNGGKGVSVYQNRVINELASRYTVPVNRFYKFYDAPVGGKEDTTRSRSLMFFSHAIVLASGMGHQVDLCIPENGVISLNIPLTIHRVGSLSTRTTHPFFIKKLQSILNGLEIPVRLYNPYQFFTKGEMMLACKDKDFLNEKYHLTMSCSHPDLGRWMNESSSNHCGVCLPCTIRRAAIQKAGLSDNSIYRDPSYSSPEARLNLNSFRLGLAKRRNPLFAIQLNGKIDERYEDYAGVYERGIKELKDFIDNL